MKKSAESDKIEQMSRLMNRKPEWTYMIKLMQYLISLAHNSNVVLGNVGCHIAWILGLLRVSNVH